LNKNFKKKIVYLAIFGYSSICKKYLKILNEIKFVECHYILTNQKNIDVNKYYKKNKVKITNDIEDIISDIRIKKILILNEPSKHLNHVIKLLKKDINLLIEKPLYNKIDSKLFNTINETINLTNSNIYVVSQYRYDGAILKMRERIVKEDVTSCFLKISMPRSKDYYNHGNKWRLKESSIFFNQAYHWIDILYWFFGEIKKIDIIEHIKATNNKYISTTKAKLNFENHLIAQIYGTTGSKNKYIDFKIYKKNKVIDYKLEKILCRFKDFFNLKFHNMNSSQLLMKKQLIDFLHNRKSNLVDFNTSLKVLKTVLNLSKIE